MKTNSLKAIFPIIIITILSIPILHFDQREISGEENRLLAKFPDFNKEFGPGFDKWLADRFNGRTLLMKLYRRINGLNAHVVNERAFEGLNGWQFAQAEIKAQRPFNEKQLGKINNNLLYLRQFCQGLGIKCYVLIAPRKEDFVGTQNFTMPYPDKARALAKKFGSLLPIVFPDKEMTQANSVDYVYFKTDHHWTEWGAYTAYRALMSRLHDDFPDIRSLTEDDFQVFYSSKVRAEVNRQFWQGHTCKLLNLTAERCLDETTRYKYYKIKDESGWQLKKYRYDNQIATKEQALNNKRTIIIGNSFVENFMPFWANSFSETKKIRTNDPHHDNFTISRWQDEIAEFHPDIMVLIMNSFYSFQLGTLR